MDGRRLRKWAMCGGLLAAALGCHRNNVQNQFSMPKTDQSLGAFMPGGKVPSSGNSLFSSNSPAIGQGPMAGMPIESAPPKREGKGFSPDGEVAIADTHVAAALGNPPAANRDELLDMARLRYQKALKEDPKNQGALLGMARMYANVGDKERSLEIFQEYMKLYPNDAVVPHEVALLFGRWKDWNGAVAWCEVSLKIDPENRTHRKTLGFCLARSGRWDESFVALKQVMPEAQARYSLARVMEHLNFPEQSRQQLVAAVQADPNYAEARDFLAELDQGYQFAQPNAVKNPNPIMQAGYAPQP